MEIWKCRQDKQDGEQFFRLACVHVDPLMELTVKVNKRTGNMESNLLLGGVTELERGLCRLNVWKRSFNDICDWATIVVSYSGRITFAMYIINK